MSYKRPIPRKDARARTEFKTEIRADGTRVGYWGAVLNKARIASGTPGVVGQLVDKMRLGNASVKTPIRKPWTPPTEYEFIAERMPEGEREAYLARCREWFAAQPPRVQMVRRDQDTGVDHAVIAAMYTKCGGTPPIAERVKVYAAAGCSQAYIAKAIARDKHWKDTKAARDAAFDLIFAKWPSASKPTPKPKKVIKAVKKRMNP
jgi:hypothetical protein